MGCTQSKIENEEAVSRCKERKLYMKEAVSYRNAFAAAHFAYAMALKNTGAALSDYAHGEVQNPQSITSHHSASNSAAAGAAPSTFESPLPPPPPPLPNLPSHQPLQRAVTMPEIKIPTSAPNAATVTAADPIIEEETEEDMENFDRSSHLRQRSSRSTRNSRSGNIVMEQEDEGGPRPPPSPPRTGMSDKAPPISPSPSPPRTGMSDTWDYFFFPKVENIPGPTLSEVEEEVKIDEEQIERRGFDEMPKRVEDEVGEAVEGRRSGKGDGKVVEKAVEPPAAVVPVPPVAAKNVKKAKQGPGAGSVEGKRGGKVPTNVNLLQIFIELDDHFLKASESAHEVSKMLEATRLHYHSNFADNRGHIDHSARVMRVITWNRSFKGISNPDDGKDDFDSEEHETHATVLDKLLAWEKKLYDEVKAGELMKFEYQRKVSLLNKQKKRSSNPDALEKTKAAVSHLHTRYIVDMQSMDSTVSEINHLRDDQLYPKLIALVDGMGTMWEAMRVHHESQSKIVTALRYLDINQSPKETSEHHHERTIQLFLVVQEWHSQFDKLMNQQKEYIKSLNEWLRLNLIPIESSLKEKVSSPPRPQKPPIRGLLLDWKDHLDKLPDELARSAISNFAAALQTITQQQEDEMKQKEKCKDIRKELERKVRQFEDWEHKYNQRKAHEEVDPERAEDSTQRDIIAEKRLVVDSLRQRLAEEEETYQKLGIQVREKALASLKLRLPGLFRSMSDFSQACSDMYRNLRSISEPQDQNELS